MGFIGCNVYRWVYEGFFWICKYYLLVFIGVGSMLLWNLFGWVGNSCLLLGKIWESFIFVVNGDELVIRGYSKSVNFN